MREIPNELFSNKGDTLSHRVPVTSRHNIEAAFIRADKGIWRGHDTVHALSRCYIQ